MYRMLLMVLLLPAAAFGASFDCKQAKTTVEQLICRNDDLSALDDTLAESFQQEVAAAASPNTLRAAQKAWLATRNRCTDTLCLQPQYEQRIAALSCDPDSVMAGSAIGASQCAYFSRLGLDRQLNTLEAQYRQKISRGAEHPDHMTRIVATEQNAWRQYRTARCALYGALEGGSDAWKNAFAGFCEVEETQKRIEGLKVEVGAK